MKKLKLTVAEPCHENWSNMTPEQQGRFCASCQKTVVDFTHMSDQQLAAFFQQPAGNVCGRFYNDQLNRNISLPDKRRTLPKHFFRYSWPALLLLLKSCTEKEDERLQVLGAVFEETLPEAPPMIGLVRLQPVIDDTTVFYPNAPIPIQCTQTIGITTAVIKGETAAVIAEEEEEIKQEVADTAFVAIDQEMVSLDTITVTAFTTKTRDSIMMGAVAVSTCSEPSIPIQATTDKKDVETKTKGVAPVLFPNPVLRGQTLNISFDNLFDGTYQVFGISGQLLKSGSMAAGKGQRFSLPVPAWPPGTYIIQLVDEKNGIRSSQKFMVQ
jgi:hypothetical protein